MADPNDLVARAREFAHRISNLLNRTVTGGAVMGAVIDDRTGECRVAPHITTRSPLPRRIPLTIGGKAPSCFLLVSHRLIWDPESEYLADARSSCNVYRDAEGNTALFRYEYKRHNTPHPEAHFHMHGDFHAGLPVNVRPPRKVHFPVGGRRFRPSVEDVIEFLVREGFTEGQPGWEIAVKEHRKHWETLQLKAAVRRDHEVAIEQLRADGWI